MITLFFPSNSSTTPPASAPSSGLSKSDMIAVGLGVPSALVAIATLIVMLLRRRDKEKQTRERLREKLEAIEYRDFRKGNTSNYC